MFNPQESQPTVNSDYFEKGRQASALVAPIVSTTTQTVQTTQPPATPPPDTSSNND